MKISKVRETKGKDSKLTINAKTAIVFENNKQEGILYNDPARAGKAQKDQRECESYINSRIKSSRKLYSVFSKPKDTDQSRDIESKNQNAIMRAFSAKDGLKFSDLLSIREDAFERYAQKSFENRKAHVESSPAFDKLGLGISSAEAEKLTALISESEMIKRIRDVAGNAREKGAITESVIDATINQYLKKSLCREKTRKALKLLLMKAYGLNCPVDASINIQRDFIDAALEDYFRVRVKGQVTDSIRRKTMPVQPLELEQEIVFAPTLPSESKKSGSRKREEKEAFIHFLSEYADLNLEKRKDLLLRLRRLINLYFYGMEEAESLVLSEDFDVWKDHARHGDRTEVFISVPPAVLTGNKKEDKLALRIRSDEVKARFREKNIACYRKALAEIEADENGLYFKDMLLNRFVIQRIEDGVERVYTSFKGDQDYKMALGYLSEKVWKDLINYMSVKYISIGKAVYNYAMDGLTSRDKNIEMGKINESYISGICSFDYELIKAEEMLQRELAVYVAFAARHISHQTVDLDENDSDFLLIPDKKHKNRDGKNIQDYVNKDINLGRVLLQYFGGKSEWVDFPFDKYRSEEQDDVDLLLDFQKAIYSMRNDSFHYKTENHDGGSWNMKQIGAMFAFEADRVARIQKDKFFSNNLPRFYSDNDLKRLLTELYKENVERASQVPSFNSVFVRKKFPEICRSELGIRDAAFDDDSKLKFYNALYYMFKEIYYNAFLQDKNVLERFVSMSITIAERYDMKYSSDLRKQAREIRRNGDKDRAKKLEDKAAKYEAENDFGQRVLSIQESRSGVDLAQICQLIMTEYNQQNNGQMRRKSTDSSKHNPDSYKHYKMLLLLYLRKAFAEYVKEQFGFVFAPKEREPGKKEDFMPDFAGSVKPYEELVKKVEGSAELQKWYIVSRFLSPKQVNHLLGSVHSYKQYVWDVYRRADEVGAKVDRRVSEDKIAGENIKDIDAVIDLCVKLSGTTSNVLDDYFDGKEGFANYLRNYLDYGYNEGDNAEAVLWNFCQENATEESKDGKEGIYYDGDNPILNRNIILSLLFSEEKLLHKITRPVNKSDLKEYYQLKKEIAPYQTMGIFDTIEKQKAIKSFQEIKNHIEFRDVVDYSEIADTLQGQLINWIYLRERDLMYFQLGFHYVCLHNASEKPDSYKTITYKDEKTIDNAILYQICAMYINGVPMYTYTIDKDTKKLKDKDSPKIKEKGERASTGAKIEMFEAYTCGFEKECTYYSGEEMCYMAGMELFESVKEHKNIIDLRNYIEHFHYFTNLDRSMLDIYSEIFDRFFTYDMKYRKNVPNILYNILLTFFVKVKLEFISGKKMVGGEDGCVQKDRATITIPEDGGIVSEKFTYKLKDIPQPLVLPARGIRYLQTVARLLFYPEEKISDSMVKDLSVRSVSEKTDNSREAKKGNYHSKEKEKTEEQKYFEEYQAKKPKINMGGLGRDLSDIMEQLKDK